ncbi:MAG TPA: pyridoxamine kinase, partial [Firmicutes bacterium]|nr:pyridoxamine kinase [Bacillota bacterium]
AIPTAVLSTHTGGLGEVVHRDLTDYIAPTLQHYQEINLHFDCVYSGFLLSQAQFEHCDQFFKSYPEALAVVDPVMGDHGKTYRTCTPEIRAEMRELVKRADVITPNLTEARILLQEEYSDVPLTVSEAKKLLLRLSHLGPKYVLITGVEMVNGVLSNLGYDSTRNAFWHVECDYVPVSYPGTGDIFASIIVGSLLSGDSLPIAMERATRFLELAIKTTFSYGTDPRYGVMLEKSLPWLTQKHSLQGYHIL